MPFTPTPEQEACVLAASSTPDNLLVSALAGAAKTSTLVLMAEALPAQSILCLAFNKRIQLEMKERLPANCTSLTLNSLGYRSWGAFLRRRCTVDAKKNYTLIKRWVESHVEPDELEEFWEGYDIVKKSIELAKYNGYVPSHYSGPVRPLLNDEDFDEIIPYKLTETQVSCVLWCLEESIKEGLRGHIDYDDMIYLPVIFPSCTFPRFDTIMVDEAQDLSGINHAMLAQIARGHSRIIAVGDSKQAIYGFRGAVTHSMKLLAEQFEMRQLSLSISFRCPKAVVRAARFRAPNMQWPEWAIEGEVSALGVWSPSDIPDIATILCRNNAPLFNLAIKLLRAGRYVELVGGGIDKYLAKILKGFGLDLDQAAAKQALLAWRDKETERQKDERKVADLYESLLAFIEAAPDIRSSIREINKVFSGSGNIKLMTGHKAKGFEFEDVFILNRSLIQDNDQDQNLLYVMMTRTKRSLTYINSGDFQYA